MAKKVYAVKKGRVPGIYQTWSECREQVDGFSGAVFKSFEKREEALDFLKNEKEIIQTEAKAYCDGSFDVKTGNFSYGAIIFWKNEKYEFSEAFTDKELARMRNVAGEIKGAEKIFSFCKENKISSVEIFYDYEGIEKWCTGVWKRNKAGTIRYHEEYNKVKEDVNVQFTKVKAHTGDEFNERADALAKAALGIK